LAVEIEVPREDHGPWAEEIDHACTSYNLKNALGIIGMIDIFKR
jgi:hypothetical protein